MVKSINKMLKGLDTTFNPDNVMLLLKAGKIHKTITFDGLPPKDLSTFIKTFFYCYCLGSIDYIKMINKARVTELS